MTVEPSAWLLGCNAFGTTKLTARLHTPEMESVEKRKSCVMSLVHENVTLKPEIAWMRGRAHACLAAMDPAQCYWLAQLQTSQAIPPRKSSNGNRKSTCELGASKVTLKPEIAWMRGRVHACLAAMDPAQCNWLVQLQSSHTWPQRMERCSPRKNEPRVRKEVRTPSLQVICWEFVARKYIRTKRHANISTCVYEQELQLDCPTKALLRPLASTGWPQFQGKKDRCGTAEGRKAKS